MKKTAAAPSNIAFIKYWGKKDERLRLPTNGSISMNLSNLSTTTTVDFSSGYQQDSVIVDGSSDEKQTKRVIKHLDRIRELAKVDNRAKVVSKNNFPVSTGLSSSASGFAALTLAGICAAGLSLSERQLSQLARLASGSSCRSIPDGFVEWKIGDNHQSSYAVSIFPADWWDIIDVVVVVSRVKKEISTAEGQKLAKTSLFFKTRLIKIKDKISRVKLYIERRDFKKFGELVENEALELHSIMFTSKPSLIYLLPETLKIMRMINNWRNEGLPAYFTVNTGQNIHLICQKGDLNKIVSRLKNLSIVKDIIVNKPTKGAYLTDRHLF